MKFKLRDDKPAGAAPVRATGRRGGWGPIAAALGCGLALVGLACLPYDRLNAAATSDYQVIERMPEDRPVSSVQDVIDAYGLDANVAQDLEVDSQKRIRFRGQLPPAAPRKAEDKNR